MAYALVTGASSGLGTEFVWQLARAGYNVVLVARDEQRLAQLAQEVREQCAVEAEVLPADLSVLDDTQRVAQRIRDASREVRVLVNNAGFGLGQDFLGGAIERECQALDVMVRAVLILSHAAAQSMVEFGGGIIINVSSMTALTAQGTYSAHKAWVRTFSEGLAAELAGTDVSVTAVTPGLIRTEFHERSHVDAAQWPDWVFATAPQVVRAALDAAWKGRVLVTPTLLYQVTAGVTRLAPRWLVRRLAGPGRSGRSISPSVAGIPPRNKE
ncbi:SDR family NAD(P)-dependent oxidoreductase [Trueperella sp. LYQ141]|uniref:SDR family NAD(P)-dependent oxidoreductase n=1 Tax=Trueperella sp. LYQ141 TaxID=3391058 RepID=UPI0039830925